MKFDSPMIVVENIEASKVFYQEVLKQKIKVDLQSYVIWEGDFSMMSIDQWKEATHSSIKVISENNSFELYFEEEDYDAFILHLKEYPTIRYLHDTKEFPWGQRGLRFYDVDHHIIEVAESMTSVAKRFLALGYSIDETAEKIMFPREFVEECSKSV
ncbi:glyoxalase/bleomycin resistance/dioxygenase family protein [Enterococcus sp. AZ192]|uniref:glyoxalase/bleomycin resistance/dioxygenase family protein n=1 Tax=unclassified Enterococcus TaxID=2608891 RepID=UPI003D26C15D